ncbi:MAG TPA: pyridoxamine 5'-phosphate oxidase family protein [Actinomycetota bacterium]|nr:pyridoxamine 5'-phosphate oxidase family protein [Actinomycetota bacterium]
MSARPSKAALDVLERGVLCHLAVATAHGPHLTPVVYVLHAGRLWLTTARSSVKARAWRSRPEVAGLIRHEGLAVTFRGRVITYDALDPLSWPGAVVGAPRIATAATRFSMKNARFFAGYAVDANRVPLSWSPPGRVFAAVRLTAGWLLAPDGPVGEGWGSWTTGTEYRKTFGVAKGSAVDRKVPSGIRTAIGDEGEGALGLQDEGRLTVLPAAWRRVGSEGAYDAVLPTATLALADAGLRPRAAITVDRASRWRASAMTGILLQGPAELHSLEATTRGKQALRGRLRYPDPDDLALVRVRPDRVVWWRGWTGGRVARMSGAAS